MASASDSPSQSPSESPSGSPSASPSNSPSKSPSASPSRSPSASFSASPSRSPSESASVSASKSPSESPSESFSASPSTSPSEELDYDGSFQLPVPRFTGTLSNLSLSGTFVIPKPTMSGTIEAPFYMSGSFSVPVVRFSGTLLTAFSGTFAIPMLRFSDRPLRQMSGSFKIPLLRYAGYGSLLPISRVYRGVVMNLLNQAISTYSNFDFNSLADFNGVPLGATDTGIHILSGNTDNGTRINAHVKSGPMDFGDNYIKYIRDIWLTHRTDGHLALLLLVDEKLSTLIEKHTSITGNDEIREERIKPPRGLKGRFYTIELKNLSGADFDIDSLSLLVETVQRKIR